MDEFSRYLRQLRDIHKLLIVDIASATNVSAPTVYGYLSGSRPVTESKREALRKAMCKTPEECNRFDDLFRQRTQSKLAQQNALQVPFDSEEGHFRIEFLPYQPFSGSSDAFVEQLLRIMLSFSGIPSNARDQVSLKAVGEVPTFSMVERIRKIDAGEAAMVVNLVSLERMKHLTFLELPIAISLNGVLNCPSFDPHYVELIAAAQEFLAPQRKDGRKPTFTELPFEIWVVRTEVGHIFLKALGFLDDSFVNFFETLDPVFLAKELSILRPKPALLLVDELTALSVCEKMAGEADLVFPPSTEQAVIHLPAKNQLSTHYLGLGLRRLDNWQQIEFYNDALSTLLSLESERVAALFEDLYNKLIARVSESLRYVSFFRGGFRRDPAARNPMSQISERVLKNLTAQNARAFGRRCLYLSMRSQRDLPNELFRWRRLLARARERVQISDAKDRGRIKDVVLASAKTALSMDPLTRKVHPLASEQLSSSQLLCEVYLGKSVAATGSAAPSPAVAAFQYILERELDVDLSSFSSLFDKEMLELGGIEKFVTELQRIMETTQDTTHVVTIRRQRKEDEGLFQSLWTEYSDERKRMGRGQPRQSNSVELEGEPGVIIRLLAFSLGEPSGFIELRTHISSQAQEKPEIERSKSFEVKHIFVQEYQRASGISRRLIRSVIEIANDSSGDLDTAVRLDLENTPPWLESKFVDTGFERSDDDHELIYVVERKSPRRN